MIPLRDENPSGSAPAVTITLITLNVLVFVYEVLQGPALHSFIMSWGFVPARFTSSLQGGAEPLLMPALTLFSSMFLHGGWGHLLGNMWFLWIFGDNIEDRFGKLGYLLFYLAAGVAAVLVHYALGTRSAVPTVGASGAIAGVLGAYLVAYPKARVVTLIPLIFIMHMVALPAVVLLGLWFLFQFLSQAAAASMSAAGGGVAYAAHIGGFVFGVVTMLLLRGRTAPREPRPPRAVRFS